MIYINKMLVCFTTSFNVVALYFLVLFRFIVYLHIYHTCVYIYYFVLCRVYGILVLFERLVYFNGVFPDLFSIDWVNIIFLFYYIWAAYAI